MILLMLPFFIHYVMEFSIFHASIHFHFCMIAFFDIFPHLDFIDLGSLKFITFHKIWVLLFLVNLVLTGFHFFLLCFFSGFVFNVLNFLWFSSTCNLQISLFRNIGPDISLKLLFFFSYNFFLCDVPVVNKKGNGLGPCILA